MIAHDCSELIDPHISCIYQCSFTCLCFTFVLFPSTFQRDLASVALWQSPCCSSRPSRLTSRSWRNCGWCAQKRWSWHLGVLWWPSRDFTSCWAARAWRPLNSWRGTVDRNIEISMVTRDCVTHFWILFAPGMRKARRKSVMIKALWAIFRHLWAESHYFGPWASTSEQEWEFWSLSEDRLLPAFV